MMHHDVVDFNSLKIVGENKIFRSTNHYLMLKYLIEAAKNKKNIDTQNQQQNTTGSINNDKILEDDQQLYDDKSNDSSNIDTILNFDY